jgi:hypothetical protein
MENTANYTTHNIVTNNDQTSVSRPLAIVALCLAGISVIIPVIGIIGAFISCWLAACCFKHQQQLALITAGISIINIFLLSPFLWGIALESSPGDGMAFTVVFMFSLIFQMIPLGIGYGVTRLMNKK